MNDLEDELLLDEFTPTASLSSIWARSPFSEPTPIDDYQAELFLL